MKICLLSTTNVQSIFVLTSLSTLALAGRWTPALELAAGTDSRIDDLKSTASWFDVSTATMKDSMLHICSAHHEDAKRLV